jgi:undecaprenyl diphosphate synthase
MQEHIFILTVYAFSSENWNRDVSEVTTLMTIFAKYAETFRIEALAKDIRVNVFSTGKYTALLVLLMYSF